MNVSVVVQEVQMESCFERPRPNMTFMMNSTMALPGWSASSSAKMWHALSVGLPCFLATKPNILQNTAEHRMNSQNPKEVNTCGHNKWTNLLRIDGTHENERSKKLQIFHSNLKTFLSWFLSFRYGSCCSTLNAP